MSMPKKWLAILLAATMVAIAVAGVLPGGLWNKVQSELPFTLGTVQAAGVADATADGVADNVEAQTLLTALPATGGRISILTGTYAWANLANVTRAIGNVMVDGTGYGTYVDSDGVTAPFTAGGNNWVISNMRFDAPGPNMGATTGWSWQNVWVGATYYAYRTAAATTGAAVDIPTGRGATLTVAGANTTATVKAQADYVWDGTGDATAEVIQPAINALTAGRTWKESVRLLGDFTASTAVVIYSYTILEIQGSLSAANGLNHSLIENDAGVGVGAYDDPGVRDTDIEICGGGIIDGNKANQVGASDDDNTIHMQGVNNLSIHDLTVNNGWTGGIRTTYSSYVNISNNRINNSTDDGLEINDTTTYATVASNIVTNAGLVTFYGAPNGIEVQDGANHISLVGNTIIGSKSSGIEVSVHAGELHNDNITIIGNTIDTPGLYGIAVTGVGAEISHDIVVQGNTISSPTFSGIRVEATATKVTVDTNVVVSPGSTGILTFSALTTINGNIVSSSTAGGIRVTGATASGTIVSENTVSASAGAGIVVDTNATDVIIADNNVATSTDHGISVDTSASHALIQNNTVTGGSLHGIYVGAISHSIIQGNNAYNNTSAGIYVLTTATYNQFIGNTTTDNDIGIGVFGDNNLFEANIGTNTAAGKVQRYGIVFYAGGDNNSARNNQWYTHTVDNFLDAAGTNELFWVGTNLFQDVVAASAAHVRSNQDLSAATPITFTIDAQPDIPRNFSWSFDSHAQITAYSITVTGTSAKGFTVTETWTEAAGWSGTTNNAFAKVTSIIFTRTTGTGVGDTMDFGIGDKFGLAGNLYLTSDVFKIKKNNADATTAVAQVSATYDTYDMSVITYVGGDDITIWYRNQLNITS